MSQQAINAIDMSFVSVIIEANKQGYTLRRIEPFTQKGLYQIMSIDVSETWEKNFQTLQEVSDWLNDPGEF